MSDLMLFLWIATFLVVSPIASRYLIKRFRADGVAWCGIALSGYVVFTLYLNRVPASDRSAFLMVAAWTLFVPVIAFLVVHTPSARRWSTRSSR